MQGDPGRPLSSVAAAPVWYVAYGSNLAADRFACYLAGGRPEGGARTYGGCADPTPARRSEAVTIRHRVGFAGRSAVWGGGMAVLEALPQDEVRTPARAWLVTADQLADIVAQERHAARVAIDVARVLASGRHTLGPGMYGTVVHCGELDGLPLLTCTADVLPTTWTAPASGYLRWIARGLQEAHGMGADDAVAYLGSLHGLVGQHTPAALRGLLATTGIR